MALFLNAFHQHTAKFDQRQARAIADVQAA